MLEMNSAPKAMAAVKTVMKTGGKRRKSSTLRGSRKMRLALVASFLLRTFADSLVVMRRIDSAVGSISALASSCFLRASVSGRRKISMARMTSP